MNTALDIIRKSRSQALPLFEEYTAEQLNQIPAGFNNNILWNLAHLIATDEMVWYNATGNTPRVTQDYISSYRRGTKPERPFTSAEISDLKNKLITLVDTFEEEVSNNSAKFSNYNTWTTSSGITIASINDAMTFSAYHQGLHAAAINTLKKFIK